MPTAFALIELLVVITTIALLAGLLFLRSHMLDWLLNGGPADLTLPES